jgi:hypothetical protein
MFPPTIWHSPPRSPIAPGSLLPPARNVSSPLLCSVFIWSLAPLCFSVVPLLWLNGPFTVLPVTRQEAGSASGRQVGMKKEGWLPRLPDIHAVSVRAPGGLRVKLRTSLGRDQPRVRQRLDVVMRRTRRRPHPQIPNELVGVGRGEPAEPRSGPPSRTLHLARPGSTARSRMPRRFWTCLWWSSLL